MISDRDSVAFDGRVVHRSRSGLSVLFYIKDSDEEHWFPLSQIELTDDDTSILMPNWLARKKGLA